jgi:ABC-type siderophore export system fused ATPase/permease subunit
MKNLEIQWQDHFQTRAQTWKALEITGLLAVALVGLDWQIGNRAVTIAATILLFLIAQFGIFITLKHREVERTKFKKIAELEEKLGIADEKLQLPQPISWWSIFNFQRSNSPLFILRMHFIIQLFAIGYCVLRLFS